MRQLQLVAFALSLSLLAGCNRNRTTGGGAGYGQQGQYPQGQYPNQGYPNQGYPNQGYPNQGYPNQPYPPQGQPPGQGPVAQQPQQPQQPPAQPGLPSLPAIADPINNLDMNWLRSQAGIVMGEDIAALAPGPRSRVENIPFIADPTPGEVNAFAACDDQGKPLMAITDGLLEIEAQIAQFRATDEIFGTKKFDQYVQLIAQNSKPGQPLPRPALGFIDPLQHIDGRKVNRQHELFDEQVGFVLGHELGHHYLGHLGCTAPNGTAATTATLGHLLSRALPVFNQPNEIAADIAGTNNVLDAGKRRSGYHLTEGGAVLTLNFFAALDQLTPSTIIFNFERSHPPPQIRRPIVQQTASTWRATGGGFKIPGLGG